MGGEIGSSSKSRSAVSTICGRFEDGEGIVGIGQGQVRMVTNKSIVGRSNNSLISRSETLMWEPSISCQIKCFWHKASIFPRIAHYSRSLVFLMWCIVLVH